MIADVTRQLHMGARSCARRPAFFLTAVLIIGLGVGAITTVFSVVDGVVLKPLAFHDPGRLVYFTHAAHSFPAYRDWKARLRSFEDLAAIWRDQVDYSGAGTPERLEAAFVTPETLSMIGAAPILGRPLRAADGESTSRAALLGYGAWQRLFGGAPQAVGRTVTVNGLAVTVVGVLPAVLRSPAEDHGQVDLWLPVDSAAPELEDYDYRVVAVVGRLKEGVSLAAARAELQTVMATLFAENPDAYATRSGKVLPVDLVPLQEAVVGPVAERLYLLLAAVALMLAVACANVANLFLSRGTERAWEMAVRTALGAGRVNVAAQLLVESVMIALAGGALGALLAVGGCAAFRSLCPGDIPLVERVDVDLRVLAFAALVSLLVGVVCGMAPAWQATRVGVNEILKGSRAGVTEGPGRHRLRNALVVAEIGVALVLVTGAGLLFHSLARLEAVDPGFEPGGLVAASVNLGEPAFDQARRQLFGRQLLDRVQGIGGVKGASLSTTVPFQLNQGLVSGSFADRFETDHGPVETGLAVLLPVTPDYFSVLGVQVRGQVPTADATSGSGVPVVLSAALARRLYGEKDPIGQVFTVYGREGEVVGVASDVHHWGPVRGSALAVYLPWEAAGPSAEKLTVLVHTDLDPAAAAAALRAAIWAVEPTLPVGETFTLRARVASAADRARFFSELLGSFAVLTMALAASGIAASLLFSVGQRRRELAIRSALGADRIALLRTVLVDAARLTAFGLAAGVVGAGVFARALRSMLFGVAATDVPTFAGAVGLLAVVAMTAALVPAIRACRIDPVTTLRAE